MSAADGYISGITKVVDHGANSLRYNLVFLGDGYQVDELPKFHTNVQTFINTLQATAPFTNLWCDLNIHRVDVVSNDSGADDPGTSVDGSAGTGATPKTYFDATFGGEGNLRRLLTCDSARAHKVAVAQVPEVYMTMVLVNSSQYGGSGGPVVTFSANVRSAEIALYEMGHFFADEREYYQSGGSGGADQHDYTCGDAEPNGTIYTNKIAIIWQAEMPSSADNLSTTVNAGGLPCESTKV